MNDRTIRNVAIVAGIALAITVSQTAGNLARYVMALLQLALLVAMLWFARDIWRRERYRLQWLSTRERNLLYAAVGALALIVVGSLVYSFVGSWSLVSSLVFFLLVGALAAIIWKLWGDARRYY